MTSYSDALAKKLTGDTLLTPIEVAAMFRVDPKTVTRWAQAGKLDAIRTLGGHRRYRTSQIRALLQVRLPSGEAADTDTAADAADAAER